MSERGVTPVHLRISPNLRADFEMVETYRYRHGPALDCPVTAFGGERDADLWPRRDGGWDEQTTARFAARFVPGNHFFLNDPQMRALMLRAVASEPARVP
jgi:medium-chain acyl-[acyl-carrier-protein] hydrolase